jgi:hypothetical protein
MRTSVSTNVVAQIETRSIPGQLIARHVCLAGAPL